MKDLRVLRAERRLSQEETAKAIGVTRVTYNRIENERSIPKLETVQRLAELFDLTVDELLKG